MRRAVFITAVGLIASGVAATAAGATFPGHNGPIAFRQYGSPDGSFPLLRARPDGTHVRQLSDRPGFFSDWRADGRRIAFDFFDADGNEQIATVTARGGGLREITSGQGIHEIPSWSANGRRIVFDFSPEPDPETPGFETRLWTMHPDGSHARPLPMPNPGFDNEPKYSPNGRWIVFVRLRHAGDQQLAALFIVRAEGGSVRQLTPFAASPSEVEHPTWSPDSRWILFDIGADGTIQAMRPDGSGRHTILPAIKGRGGHKPWLSPDGSRILFMCENQGTLPDRPDYDEDICVMHANGSNVVNITKSPNTGENWPSWGPAPSDDQHHGKHDQADGF
jgi:Tol biopolymer transport system component